MSASFLERSLKINMKETLHLIKPTDCRHLIWALDLRQSTSASRFSDTRFFTKLYLTLPARTSSNGIDRIVVRLLDSEWCTVFCSLCCSVCRRARCEATRFRMVSYVGFDLNPQRTWAQSNEARTCDAPIPWFLVQISVLHVWSY